MNAPIKRAETPETVFDQAQDRLVDAIDACNRGHLRSALEFVQNARRILETEQQFRDARSMRT